MRWRKCAIGAAAAVALAWSAIAVAQSLAEREARALLDGWVKSPPAPFKSFAYGEVTFDVVQRRLTVLEIELEGATDTERVTIGSVSIVDPQPSVLANVIDPARYGDGKGQGDFARAASQMELRDIHIEADDGETSVAAVGIGAVDLRQFALAPTAANLGDEPARIIGIVAPGVRISEIVVNGLRHKDAEGSNGARVARLTVRGIDAGRMEEARADDLRFLDGDEDSVTVGSITIAGVDLTRALPDMAAGRPVSGTDPNRKPQFDRWELLTLGGPALAGHGIRLARMGADVSRSADRMTERTNFRVEGIELAAPSDPDSPVARLLAGLGYTSLTGTVACVSDSDNARKSWKVEPCGLAVPGAGNLSLAYSVSGLEVSAPASIDGSEAVLDSLAAASFDWLRLVYRDEGLTNRAIAHAARSSDQLESAFRQALIEQVRQGAEAYGGGSDRVRAVAGAVAAFLGQPGTLTVALEPSAPVAFGTLDAGLLVDPAAAAERLGLTGRHAP